MSDHHIFPVHVYYEDTDLAGIVYYANYFKYIERARTEWVRMMGIDQNLLREQDGLVFAVKHVEADYISPARFDDELHVATSLDALTGARVVLQQDVKRGADLLFSSKVTLVALSADGRAVRLPAAFRPN